MQYEVIDAIRIEEEEDIDPPDNRVEVEIDYLRY
jgi:hypothetical protein